MASSTNSLLLIASVLLVGINISYGARRAVGCLQRPPTIPALDQQPTLARRWPTMPGFPRLACHRQPAYPAMPTIGLLFPTTFPYLSAWISYGYITRMALMFYLRCLLFLRFRSLFRISRVSLTSSLRRLQRPARDFVLVQS
ncbi:uncharacterized protein A4U43_C03F5980 [Asparagus officinalis]|uniref:Uncharacterized protein n=1 Tax=Asparagus officinalis TaxID=4686 RepID=A0A5P1F7R0_ASPOF|nr:uncharacterized protein A4U43_C03F5980 [Asparagus officinalis]